MKWRLIISGPLDPLSIHTIYEAIAYNVSERKTPNTLHICWPAKPYICVGIHQAVDLEVDIDECRRQGLEIVRRQVGGGTVYLDQNQFFYHIIAHKKDAPRGLKELFSLFLKPTVCTYRKFGVNAEYRPLNDVVVDGKKISGNGAASFGNAVVVVGNVILDIDPKKFASILRVPTEKVRDKLIKSIDQWVSSLKKEIGYAPTMDNVAKTYIECFSELFGAELIEDKLTKDEIGLMEKLKNKYGSDEWLYKYRRRHKKLLDYASGGRRKVKIMEGHYIIYIVDKPEKLFRIITEIKDGMIIDILISGDFFMNPPDIIDSLEQTLIGTRIGELRDLSANNIARQIGIDPKKQKDTTRIIEQILLTLSKIEL